MRVFGISFFVFLVFFGVVYFLATQSGAPRFGEGLPIEQAFGGVLIAVVIFSFWITMLVHCFSSNEVNNRVAWGLCLIFFSWFAAVLYFFAIYRKQDTLN